MQYFPPFLEIVGNHRHDFKQCFGSELAKLSTDQISAHFGSTLFLMFENFCNSVKKEKSHHYFDILIANIISRRLREYYAL